MEASSHGLDQRRLDGVRLTAAGFTNLSRDHLDYHASLDDYLDAKLRLFRDLLQPGQTAVVAADGEYSERVIEACRARGLKLFTVGAKGEGLRLKEARAEGFSLRLDLVFAGRDISVKLPLAGRFQAENALVAAGLALAAGAPAEKVFAALEILRGAPGRLERVGDRNGAPVFVDYAHKPDALEKALAALRPFARRRLDRRFRLRRRPRRRKTPDHGRDRRARRRRRSSSPTTIRAVKTRRQSGRKFSPPRRGRGRSATAPRPSAPAWRRSARATCCSSPARATKPGRSSAEMSCPFPIRTRRAPRCRKFPQKGCPHE